MHCPADHPKAPQFLESVFNKWKLDRVVCIGDEIDAAAFSTKWPINPDLPSPGHELELAIEDLERYYKIFPKVDVCGSNHGMRLFKKARVSGIPSAVLRRYQEILKYPKCWELYPEGLEIDGVRYFHGENLSQGTWKNAHHKLKQSCVFGHLHSGGGVVYSQNHRNRYFALNSGCLIDICHPCFDYGRHLLEKPTIGCGVVIDGEEAHFIPMPKKLERYR